MIPPSPTLDEVNPCPYISMIELIKYFLWRIRKDEVGIEAGALAFTSVLALVPALTITLSIFAMVPAFTPVKEELMNFASQNFLPVFTDAISDSITTFVSHATSMTLTGTLMLMIVSLMLIRAIDKSINRIWRGGKRKVGLTFAIYWTMLTVGPLAFGILIWASTQVIASNIFDFIDLALITKIIFYILPIVVEIGALFALYSIIPVANVKNRDALLGALIVSISFEILKRLFSIFILNFSDYEAIYGALAAAPVLMIWIYLNWWLILIGAEFTALLGLARQEEYKDQVPSIILALVNKMNWKFLDRLSQFRSKISGKKPQKHVVSDFFPTPTNATMESVNQAKTLEQEENMVAKVDAEQNQDIKSKEEISEANGEVDPKQKQKAQDQIETQDLTKNSEQKEKSDPQEQK